MTRLRRTLARTFTILAAGAAVLAQSPTHLHGIVTDESGGVLPGVTVTVAAPDGRQLAVLTTDAIGEYDAPVPAAVARLTFTLEGFAPLAVDVDARTGGSLAVPTQRLVLAPRSETVVVQGHAPAAPPPPAPYESMPPPPAPHIVPVAPHDRDSVCAPAKVDAVPESLGLIQTHRYRAGVGLYAADDQVIIDGGTKSGLSVGLNVLARRSYRIDDAQGLMGEHTAGLLQIVGVEERTAVAVVLYACDEIMRGDRLAPFVPEPARMPEAAGVPAYDRAARILFADSGQLVGAPRRFMVIDRPAGVVRAGQRVTLFRRNYRKDAIVIGDAVVVAVRHDSATIRIDHATDAIESGDWAAPQDQAAARQR